MSAFAARGYETGGHFREEEADTVAYSGPHLAELIAASGETPALTAFEVSVETTVVIPGSRSRATAESIAPVSMSTNVSTNPSTTTPATNTAPARGRTDATFRVAHSSPSRAAARRGNVLALAAAGLFFGMLVATSFTSSSQPKSVAAAAPAQVAQKHELTHETKSLVSPMHTKAVQKRAGHAYVAPPANNFRQSASTTTKAAPPRTSTETDDAQLVEERKLVLAAQLERSL